MWMIDCDWPSFYAEASVRIDAIRHSELSPSYPDVGNEALAKSNTGSTTRSGQLLCCLHVCFRLLTFCIWQILVWAQRPEFRPVADDRRDSSPSRSFTVLLVTQCTAVGAAITRIVFLCASCALMRVDLLLLDDHCIVHASAPSYCSF